MPEYSRHFSVELECRWLVCLLLCGALWMPQWTSALAVQPYRQAEHSVYCALEPASREGDSDRSYFWMSSGLSAGDSFLDYSEDIPSPGLFTASRDALLERTGKFDMTCGFPPNAGHLTLLVGPPTPDLQSPLRDKTLFYFRNFTYLYRVVHPDVSPAASPSQCVLDRGEGRTGAETLQLILFRRETTSAGPPTPIFDRIVNVTVGGRNDRTPLAVVRSERLHGVPTGRTVALRRWWPFGGHTSSSRLWRDDPQKRVFEPQPFPSSSLSRRVWYYAYHYAVEHVLLDGVGRYVFLGATGRWRRFWQRRNVRVEFTVREWRSGMGSGTPPGGADLLYEGRERVLHLLSYPPVAKSRPDHTGLWTDEEELVCDSSAIHTAQEHFLRDPIVFLNHRTVGNTARPVPGGRGSERNAEENNENSDADEFPDEDRFVAELFGLDREETSEALHRRSSTAPVPTAYSAVSAAVIASVLFPFRFLSALLYGDPGDHSASDNEFLSFLLPTRGILGSGGNGGFSLSASQVAAKKFAEFSAIQLGPLSSIQQRRKSKRSKLAVIGGSTVFTTTQHSVISSFEPFHDRGSSYLRNQTLGDDAGSGWGPAQTRYVFRWDASMPATRSVCVSIAPTQETKNRMSSSVSRSDFSVRYTEVLELDRMVLGLFAAYLALTWVQAPLLARHSSFFQAFLAGLCGILFLFGVGVYYLVKQLPHLRIGKASLYLVLTVGGAAACADALWMTVEHLVWTLDTHYGVDWKLYLAVSLGILGFVSSLLLQRLLPQTVLTTLTTTSYRAVRLSLLGRALWIHLEAAVATIVCYSLIRAAVSVFLILLWLQYDPLKEEDLQALRQERRSTSETGVPRPSGGPWSGRRRGPSGLIATLQFRIACRDQTRKHYTVSRVLLRFFRRLSRYIFFVLKRSIDDLDSEEDVDSASVTPRDSLELTHGSEVALPGFAGRPSGSPDPLPRGSAQRPSGRRSSSVLRSALYLPTVVAQHLAEELERRKHPRRYRRASHRRAASCSRRLWDRLLRRRPTSPRDRAGPNPLASVLHKTEAEERWRRSGRLDWSAAEDVDALSSDSSDSETDGESHDFFFRKPTKSTAEYFRRNLNDPLDLFPDHVYREEPTSRKPKGSSTNTFRSPRPQVRAADYEAQGRAYTQAQLQMLAQSIRSRRDPSELISRLQRPQDVMRWASSIAESESDMD